MKRSRAIPPAPSGTVVCVLRLSARQQAHAALGARLAMPKPAVRHVERTAYARHDKHRMRAQHLREA